MDFAADLMISFSYEAAADGGCCKEETLMTKRKKRLWEIFAASALCCATFLGALFGISARADETSAQKNTADLFTSYTYKDGNNNDVKGLTFAAASDICEGLKGVRVTGDGANRNNQHWYYTLTGEFHGDSEIEYAFRENEYSIYEVNEAMSFVYTDLNGKRVLSVLVLPEKSMSDKNLYGGVYAESDRTGNTFGVHTLKADGSKAEVTLTSVFGVDNMNANRKAFTDLGDGFMPKPQAKNAVKLAFGESALSVKMLSASGEFCETASFAYADYPEIRGIRENGYRLRVSDGDDHGSWGNRAWALLSNWAAAIPGIVSINGVSLGEEKVTANETYADIVYDGGEAISGGERVIALEEGKTLEGFSFSSYLGITSAGYGDLRLEAYRSGAIAFPQGGKYSKKACGEYPLRVTYGETVKDYTLVIGRNFSEIFDLGADGGVTISPVSSLGSYTGLRFNAQKWQWLYGFKGTFSGDSRIEYTFTETGAEATSFVYYGADGNRVFTAFTVSDPKDRTSANCYGALYLESAYQNRKNGSYTYKNETFAEQYGATITASMYEALTVTPDGKKKSFSMIKNEGDPTFIASTADGGNRDALQEAAGTGFLPAYNGKFAISLVFGERALSVRMDNAAGNPEEIALLEYADHPEVLSMKSGYTVKAGSGAAESRDWAIVCNEKGCIPSLISVNGVALDNVFPEIAYTDWEISYKGEIAENGKNVIEIDRMDELEAFRVNTNYTFAGMLLDRVAKSVSADETFAEKVPGEYSLRFAYGGKTNAIFKEYVVRVKATVPQLTLKKGIDGYETLFRDKNQSLTASVSDVIAEDKYYGVLSDVSISVKVPSSKSFVPWETFVLNEYGVYTVRYTARNADGAENYLDRAVRYVPSQPKIELSGELPAAGYTGKSITLPEANRGASVSVIFEGEPIALVNRKFTPEKEGKYEVTYVYTDEYEITAVKQFEISVTEDLAAPEITVEELSDRLKTGDTLIAPRATATDNADGEVSVKAEIYFNGEKVGDGEAKAEKPGIYTIVYTAVDSSGNTARKEIEAFVYSDSSGGEAEEKSGCGGGCGGGVKSALALGAITLAAAVFAICKTNKKDKKRNDLR